MSPKTKKVFLYIALVLLLAGAVTVYIKYYFVFGEGVKAGEMNYFVKKGYVFKTYEGKLIQNGFNAKGVGPIQSYEFKFSVSNEALADSLMKLSGRNVELHYKEFLGTLPWRGVTVFEVDKIVAVR